MGGKQLIEGFTIEGDKIINESTGDTIPDMPFYVLRLSTRPYNVLMRQRDKICQFPKDVAHISDLMLLREDDLLKLQNLGVCSAKEILDELGNYLRNPQGYQKNTPADIPAADHAQYEITDSGILLKDTGEILPDILLEDINLKMHWKHLLINHGFSRTSQIYSMSLSELGEKIKFGKRTAEGLLEKVTAALRQYLQENGPDTQLEEAKPDSSGISFFQQAGCSSRLNEQQREVLRYRMNGATLQEVADKLSCSRERVRQIEKTLFSILTNDGRKKFAEDQFAYLYQTYLVTYEFFQDYMHQDQGTWYYLSLRYTHGNLPLYSAAQDEKLSPEIRRTIGECQQRRTMEIDGQRINLTRSDIEEYLLVNKCQVDTTLEQFAVLYDTFIVEHHLGESSFADSGVYLNRSRINRFVYAENVLWKQNQRMRYYDTSRDMTELLAGLNLGQYRNIELSARKFLLDYPELMEKYDIRDEYELHNLLKKIHAEAYNDTLTFERMPFLLFGSFDRDQAVKEIIFANSPLTVDELAKLISRKYGAGINTIKANWLKAAAVYYHHGMYVRPADEKLIPDEAQPLASKIRMSPATEPSSEAGNEEKNDGRKMLTPREKLFRRIRREFNTKKLIGDIVISDEEFEILIPYFRSQCRYLLSQSELFECDEMLCVTLVQIGIRYYAEGTYWPYVRKILNAPQYKNTHFNWLGTSFQEYLRKRGKLLVREKKNLANILMHGFVSEKRAKDFFDFLLMFYDIDLCRDIHRLKADKSLMSGLIENIKSAGTQGRTYKLLEHTADAIRCNEKGGRIRLNRYLKLIDRAFWDPEDLPSQSGNRLTNYFLDWSSRSEILQEKRKSRKRSVLKKVGGWSPYLKYMFRQNEFRIILPSRLIHCDQPPVILWEIRHGDICKYIPTEANEAVTGYMTEEQSYRIESQDIFADFELTLIRDGESIRKWKIRKDQIRFFDLDGDQLDTSSIRAGEAVSFSAPDYSPESEAIRDRSIFDNLLMLEYHFEDGDLIIFPDKRALSIGKRPAEGLLYRNHVMNVYAQHGEKRLSVWSASPSLFARILPRAMNGTQLRVNGKPYRLFEGLHPAMGVHMFDLQERVLEEGVQISLSCFGVTENGKYHVELDIPNDHSNRQAEFMLINGLSFSFDDEPYIFRDNGILCIPEETGLKQYDPVIKQESADGQDRFAFEIPEDDDFFRLCLDDIPVLFSIPKLSYRFQGKDKWQTKLHTPVWHKDLPRILEVRYPADNIQLLLDEEGNEADDDEQHTINYQKSKEQGMFICDLKPFESYYGKRVSMRRLYIQVPGMDKPVKFLNIYTRSVFISAILKADYSNDIISGELDIHGKAQYCADVWYGDELLREKEPIVDGKLSIHTVLRNGVYKIDVYEIDDDGFSFDDPVYEHLGSHTTELINPSDLSNRHIEIAYLENADSNSYLRLKRNYRLYDLRPMKSMGRDYYAGHMVVTSSTTGEYRNDYEACIHVPDPEELTKAYLFILDEYGEEESFIYDNDRYIMRKDEDKSIRGIFKYRRFRYLLEDEYVFRINFIEKPENLDDMIQVEREGLSLRRNDEERKKTQKALLRSQDPLCRPVTWLGLSIKTVNALIRGKIETSTELYQQACSQEGLMKIRNMGRRNIEECIYGLRKIGYSI